MRLRGGALEAIVRRAVTYVRYDFREIVFPSSMPDETNDDKDDDKKNETGKKTPAFSVYTIAEVCMNQRKTARSLPPPPLSLSLCVCVCVCSNGRNVGG